MKSKWQKRQERNRKIAHLHDTLNYTFKELAEMFNLTPGGAHFAYKEAKELNKDLTTTE